ncbi:hypothetical protein IWQ60_009142 [Tieghemiomyces parasiticus]|uniref:Cyclopropane-fatty-acyl-phospholipid synthase n=1 Tax=Tieghemiomyces parasiticus TaxID=78921 RepID=A0A9W7ZQ65_9FUNG|nr:hypothetical protein IWQ60_009142 [Tieghemiomyces parasiticus]
MSTQNAVTPASLLSQALSSLRAAKDAATSGVWPTFTGTCKSSMLSMLKSIQIGQLTIVTGDEMHTFGTEDETRPPVVLRVLNDNFWARLVLRSDLGLSEAYMKEEIKINNLAGFIKLFLENRDHLADGTSSYNLIFNSLDVIMHSRLANTINNSINNISAHYDLGNDMFAEFLDPTMTYSSGVWQSPTDTLEEAQIRKLSLMIEKAQIEARDHVLEIGTGWGSFAILAAKTTGCRVTSLTLSKEQKLLAEDRIRAAGLSDRIEVLLCDYRNLDPATHQFDKIVSIEMVEAVGAEFMPTYFECAHRLLHPEHGIFAIQAITMPESRYAAYRKGVDFIRKYIFPGGECPTVTTLTEAAHVGSKGHLVLDHLENYPTDYARTLQVWRENFMLKFDKFAATQTHVTNEQGFPVYDDVFKRKWEYYFAYCEGAYATRTLGLVQMVFSRMANPRLIKRTIGYNL